MFSLSQVVGEGRGEGLYKHPHAARYPLAAFTAIKAPNPCETIAPPPFLIGNFNALIIDPLWRAKLSRSIVVACSEKR